MDDSIRPSGGRRDDAAIALDRTPEVGNRGQAGDRQRPAPSADPEAHGHDARGSTSTTPGSRATA